MRRRLLRVLTKEYKMKKAMEILKMDLRVKAELTYGDLVLKEKMERLEGNDIVDMINREIAYGNVHLINKIRSLANDENRALTASEMNRINILDNPKYKEIHVTGRIAKKLLSSDRYIEKDNRYFPFGEIATIHGVPVIKENNSFRGMRSMEAKVRYRKNPTGRKEWMREIKFIEE